MNSELTHFFIIVKEEYRLSLLSEFVYRWRVFIWVLSDALQPLLFAMLWSAVANSGTRDFTSDSIISYYFMVAFVSKFTQDWSIQSISDSIISGNFSKYLIRPFNYLAEMLGQSLSTKTLRLILILPFLGIGYFFLNERLSFVITAESLILFTTAIIVGFLMNFLLGNIFALFAFFVKQMMGIRTIYVNITSILSGEYIPLTVLPTGLFFMLELLPFRYVLSFPIEIITGSLYGEEIIRGFMISLFWIVVLYFIYREVYKIAIKKYEAEGV